MNDIYPNDETKTQNLTIYFFEKINYSIKDDKLRSQIYNLAQKLFLAKTVDKKIKQYNKLLDFLSQYRYNKIDVDTKIFESGLRTSNLSFEQMNYLERLFKDSHLIRSLEKILQKYVEVSVKIIENQKNNKFVSSNSIENDESKTRSQIKKERSSDPIMDHFVPSKEDLQNPYYVNGKNYDNEFNKHYENLKNNYGIFQRKNMNIYDIIKMAEIIYNNLPDITLNFYKDNNNKSILLDGMIKYNEVYNEYLKLNNKTRQEMVNNVSTVVAKRYQNLFNLSEFYVLSPEELQNKVNNAIKNKLIDNQYPLDNEIEGYFYKVTAKMSINEIADIYLKKRNQYVGNDANLKKFQYIFADIILRRKNQSELPLKKKSEELSKICNSYFNEVLTVDQESLEDLQIETSKNDNLDVERAKNNAKSRFYGLSKLERTVAKSSGEYAKFLSLLQSSKENQEQIEQYDKLFR